MKDPLIDDVRALLAGRDFQTPGDAAILLECLSVVIDEKIARVLHPVTLEAAVERILEEADPEFAAHRAAWCSYLRTIPRSVALTKN